MYAATWRRAEVELEAKRLRRLRELTENESARCFAELLSPVGEVALRPGSGLVEQQRILARLREQHR